MGKVNPEEEREIEKLVKLLSTAWDENTLWQAAESLKEIDPSNPMVIESSNF